MESGRDGFGRRWSGGNYDKTIINRIMLGYRPIAPKPVAGGSGSGGPSPEVFKSVRTKRKYVRTKMNIVRCKRKMKKKVEKGKDEFDGTVITLELLPPVKDSPAGGSRSGNGGGDPPTIYPVQELPIWLSFDNNEIEKTRRSTTTTITTNLTGASDLTYPIAGKPPGGAPASWVTVECLTETCMDGGELGYSDKEKIKSLETDTCPAFVSDGSNRVKWLNQAYRRMVLGEEYERFPPPAVELAVKVQLPVLFLAFACRVRVQYTWRNEKYSQTLPCDIWRMDFGGFAWRFDLTAALSLGR